MHVILMNIKVWTLNLKQLSVQLSAIINTRISGTGAITGGAASGVIAVAFLLTVIAVLAFVVKRHRLRIYVSVYFFAV